MNDMSSVIVPKSDQINADDLIGGPRTITITGVSINAGTEQPVAIRFDGDNGKPWKPCKSMSRVLVQAWGPDASKYAGRSLTLYRDPKVKWGGLEVGGIRVSHMSHIDNDMVMALTETRGKRSPFKVCRLNDAPAAKADPATTWANGYVAKVGEAADADTLEAFVSEKAAKLAELKQKRPDLHAQCITAVEARRADFSTFADEPDTGPDDDFNDDPPANPDTNDSVDPAAARLTATREQIAAAPNQRGLKAVEAEWLKHSAAYGDEAVAEIDGLIAARRKELGA